MLKENKKETVNRSIKLKKNIIKKKLIKISSTQITSVEDFCMKKKKIDKYNDKNMILIPKVESLIKSVSKFSFRNEK